MSRLPRLLLRATALLSLLLRPYPAAEMVASPVGTCVNSPANDDPRCAEEEKAWE